MVKAAVRAWHASRNLSSIFDDAWDDRARLFWAGLKKRADHTSRAKRHMSHQELLEFQSNRLEQASNAGKRDAACAAVCFYGVRRSNEALHLQRSHVELETDAVKVFVAKQKNDPEARGMVCWIPRLEELGRLCPYLLVADWLFTWQAAFGSEADGPFFCVTGRQSCKTLSYDSWRKCLCNAFTDKEVGTHTACEKAVYIGTNIQSEFLRI